MKPSFTLEGQIVDVHHQRIYSGVVIIENGVIIKIEAKEVSSKQFILPGFIDAHVHIESSLLVPSEFARMAVLHGTVATVSDPHEIANVLGVEGVHYMLNNASLVPFYFYFGAPSCVPATIFETAGAELTPDDVSRLLALPEITYLAEMMNYPGVLSKQSDVMQKLDAAKLANKPVDGHAPGLRGVDMKAYFDSGITTDHECYTYEEGLEKLNHGVHVLIREGSAARNFDALIPLMKEDVSKLMFCSDDKHPDSLVLGHINQLAAKAVALGYNLFDVLQVACINPIQHYGLAVGQLRVGDSADCIVTEELESFIPIKTYIKGELVAQNGKTLIERQPVEIVNNFKCQAVKPADFAHTPQLQQRVIVCEDGSLITGSITVNGADCVVQHDIIKMAVVNRYKQAPIAIGYVQNFGLKQGAIASSVAHDSHNIIAVGVDDESMCKAVNVLVENSGGLCAVNNQDTHCLPLPVAGLMSDRDAWTVTREYMQVDGMAKALGCKLRAPFMSLSFMALLVIPHLKLSDKGLFDADTFTFVS